MKKMITRRNFLKAAGVSAAALGLAACGGSSSSTASSAASSTAASSTAAKADGKVYYLNFKPEQDQAWQDLAKVYTEETGVPVTVVTAASGQYETTLMSEMEKSEAPTLFQVNGPVGLANWKDYCYDLSGSQVYGELTSDSFALKDGDAVTSIAYVIETYGIIYNKELLTAAGYKQEDIKGFADLKKVADDIQARPEDVSVIGFDGITMSRYCVPVMTTIVQPSEQIALQSIELLVRQIEHGSPAQTVTLQPELQQGESVRAI
jgi:raffinose/stachyose/melibiose transport system substrate-binding protein